MMEDDPLDDFAREITLEQITKRVYVSDSAIPSCRLNVRFTPVSSIGQCNTSCSLLAGVSKAKVFRGR
jgi:hypothetical protein